MKNKLLKYSLLLLGIFIAFDLLAQTNFGVTDITKIENGIYGGLIIVGGYLSNKIPFFNKIGDGAWRVFAIALALGVAFVSFGFSTVAPLLVTYLGSTSLYELVLKLIIGKSKKPDTNG